MQRRLVLVAGLSLAVVAGGVAWLNFTGGGRNAAATSLDWAHHPVKLERISNGASRVTVDNAAALRNALRSARGGDVIKLAPGTYADVRLTGVSIPGDGVVITSADPNQHAVLTNFSIIDSQGLRFQGLEL